MLTPASLPELALMRNIRRRLCNDPWGEKVVPVDSVGAEKHGPQSNPSTVKTVVVANAMALVSSHYPYYTSKCPVLKNVSVSNLVDPAFCNPNVVSRFRWPSGLARGAV